jgi:hypothetical protein
MTCAPDACVRRSMMLALPMAAVTLLLNRELGMAVRGPPPPFGRARNP